MALWKRQRAESEEKKTHRDPAIKQTNGEAGTRALDNLWCRARSWPKSDRRFTVSEGSGSEYTEEPVGEGVRRPLYR